MNWLVQKLTWKRSLYDSNTSFKKSRYFSPNNSKFCAVKKNTITLVLLQLPHLCWDNNITLFLVIFCLQNSDSLYQKLHWLKNHSTCVFFNLIIRMGICLGTSKNSGSMQNVLTKSIYNCLICSEIIVLHYF